MVRFDKNLWKFTKIVEIRPKLLKFAQNLWNMTKIDEILPKNEIWPKKRNLNKLMKFDQNWYNLTKIDKIWPKFVKGTQNL